MKAERRRPASERREFPGTCPQHNHAGGTREGPGLAGNSSLLTLKLRLTSPCRGESNNVCTYICTDVFLLIQIIKITYDPGKGRDGYMSTTEGS